MSETNRVEAEFAVHRIAVRVQPGDTVVASADGVELKRFENKDVDDVRYLETNSMDIIQPGQKLTVHIERPRDRDAELDFLATEYAELYADRARCTLLQCAVYNSGNGCNAQWRESAKCIKAIKQHIIESAQKTKLDKNRVTE